MKWTALVPLKAASMRKSRLAGVLDEPARVSLTLDLFRRLVDALEGEASTIVVSDRRPPGWSGAWLRDEGRGLNDELSAACAAAGCGHVAIIHADLMLVERADIRALFAAAEATGLAIAPDHSDLGTNALAMADGRRPPMVFGNSSFSRFREVVGTRCEIVRRPGLALDCDTPDDLAAYLPQHAAKQYPIRSKADRKKLIGRGVDCD